MRDIEVLSSQQFMTQHKIKICHFKKRKVKDTRRNSIPTRKLWKLHEDNIKSDHSLYRKISQRDASVEDYWITLKEVLQATNRISGRTS